VSRQLAKPDKNSKTRCLAKCVGFSNSRAARCKTPTLGGTKGDFDVLNSPPFLDLWRVLGLFGGVVFKKHVRSQLFFVCLPDTGVRWAQWARPWEQALLSRKPLFARRSVCAVHVFVVYFFRGDNFQIFAARNLF
jgi:hypothetical protein